ncbi:MAG TPA: FAD-dependent oxidoreductase, partial [bacterium]|nr:FAD-dependent oxidoreductase [bacterium]
SSRNSEVIHAGFAYPPGSLKAELCLEGNRLTFDLLSRLGVPFVRSGKWIVAHGEEEARAFSAMMENAAACSVPGMRAVSPDDPLRACPALARPTAAAFSESSGVMDCPGYLRALEVALASRPEVQVVYPCAVLGIDPDRATVQTSRGEIPFEVLVNSAGLFSDEIYRMCGGSRLFEIRPCKGEYYSWRGGPVEGLVYPVPHRFLESGDAAKVSSMGVHLHSNVAGEKFVGPTEFMLSPERKTDYGIEISAEEIASRVAPLLLSPPDPGRLSPAFAGNRPKLFEGGAPAGDFVIFKEGPFVHLMGIESPGLTAAPAIARHILPLIIN